MSDYYRYSVKVPKKGNDRDVHDTLRQIHDNYVDDGRDVSQHESKQHHSLHFDARAPARDTHTFLSNEDGAGGMGYTGVKLHDAAAKLRMAGKGSHDPHYENSKKNK